MLERSIILALAGLLVGSACIVVDPDDEASSGSTASTPTSGRGSGSGSGSTATASEDATADGTASATASETTGTGGGACGWGRTGDEEVPDGYVCGGDGVDPGGVFPFDCPEGVTLEVGAACGDVEGPGCCGPEGDAWYCGNDGSGPALARQLC